MEDRLEPELDRDEERRDVDPDIASRRRGDRETPVSGAGRAPEQPEDEVPREAASTKPMLKAFAPRARMPPSPKKSACTASASVTAMSAAHGPTRIAMRTPPAACPVVPPGSGMLNIMMRNEKAERSESSATRRWRRRRRTAAQRERPQGRRNDVERARGLRRQVPVGDVHRVSSRSVLSISTNRNTMIRVRRPRVKYFLPRAPVLYSAPMDGRFMKVYELLRRALRAAAVVARHASRRDEAALHGRPAKRSPAVRGRGRGDSHAEHRVEQRGARHREPEPARRDEPRRDRAHGRPSRSPARYAPPAISTRRRSGSRRSRPSSARTGRGRARRCSRSTASAPRRPTRSCSTRSTRPSSSSTPTRGASSGGSALVDPSAPYEEIRDRFERNLPRRVFVYKEYHALIVEHGKARLQESAAVRKIAF